MDEIKNLVETGLKSVQDKLEASITKFEGQLAEKGKVDGETSAEVKALSEQFKELSVTVTDLAQKGVKAEQTPQVKSAGEEFVKSSEFASLVKGTTQKARVELKNTVLGSPTTTTIPAYQAGVIGGAFRPLAIRDVLPQYNTNTDLVVLTREASFTNNAAGQAQGAVKAESAVTFNKYNVPVETIAHWLKVSKQLMMDAPAVVSYIETRLRFGVDAKVDDQLLNGNGDSPNLSGLRDAGNFTVYTPVAGDNLINAINRAKYQLWATGYIPDSVIVNPADWGAQEIEQASDGQYLYGLPGLMSGMNPFGVRVVISTQMPAGQFLIGKFSEATGVWNREGTVIEMGYENDDFTRNLITLRAEQRLGLEVSVPAAILGGAFTAPVVVG
jgi:HK97 family phage major capsid protein